MPKGYSIHIGVNTVLPGPYIGYEVSTLFNCHNDVQFYAGLAKDLGYEVVGCLLDHEALRETFDRHIARLSQDMVAGDILLITFSGHGTPVEGGGAEERTGQDQAWCMADGLLIDNRLCGYWTKFKPGVRIIVVSDSCYSGDILRMAQSAAAAQPITYQTLCCGDGTPINASVILLAGCKEDQCSRDAHVLGAFTKWLKMAWEKYFVNGTHRGYRCLIRGIKEFSYGQIPTFKTIGTPYPAFEQQTPFEIEFKPNLRNVMLLFKPNILLFKSNSLGGMRYRLLVSTLVGHTGYSTAGHEFLNTEPEPNENNVPVFKIRVKAELTNPDGIEANHVLTHTIDLDNLPFPAEGELIEVTFFDLGEHAAMGKGVVHVEDAEAEDERPVKQLLDLLDCTLP